MRTSITGTNKNDVLSATSSIRETLYGFNGNDEFQFFRGGFTGDYGVGGSPDFSDRFLGGAGNDRMTNIVIDFGDVADYDAYAGVSFDGGAGWDTIHFEVDLGFRPDGPIFLNQFQTLSQSVERREFDFSISPVREKDDVLNIQGSSDNETVRITADTATGEATIHVSLFAGADQFEFTADMRSVSRLSVDMGTGHDTVRTNSSTVQNPNLEYVAIGLGSGNDKAFLDGMHQEKVWAGGGNDKIYLQTGNFGQAPDTIWTGSGMDRIFVELDEYSQLAALPDFDAAFDRIMIDADELTSSELVFDLADYDDSETGNMFMNNADGELLYRGNLMIDFAGATSLTDANFVFYDWDIAT